MCDKVYVRVVIDKEDIVVSEIKDDGKKLEIMIRARDYDVGHFHFGPGPGVKEEGV